MSNCIEKVTVADVPELNALVNSAYRGEYSKKGWTTEADLLDGNRTDEGALLEIVKEQKTVILKYTNSSGKIIGCVSIKKTGEKLYLGMLTVTPELQGEGIGKQLLHAVEREAGERQCRAIFMTVISVRKELIEWYERHGYKRTGEKIPFQDRDPRFGIPRQPLEFIVLEKTIG